MLFHDDLSEIFYGSHKVGNVVVAYGSIEKHIGFNIFFIEYQPLVIAFCIDVLLKL